MTSWQKTGAHLFYIGMYIHIYTHIYVHKYTSQKECLHIFLVIPFIGAPVLCRTSIRTVTMWQPFESILNLPTWSACAKGNIHRPFVAAHHVLERHQQLSYQIKENTMRGSQCTLLPMIPSIQWFSLCYIQGTNFHEFSLSSILRSVSAWTGPAALIFAALVTILHVVSSCTVIKQSLWDVVGGRSKSCQVLSRI